MDREEMRAKLEAIRVKPFTMPDGWADALKFSGVDLVKDVRAGVDPGTWIIRYGRKPYLLPFNCNIIAQTDTWHTPPYADDGHWVMVSERI